MVRDVFKSTTTTIRNPDYPLSLKNLPINHYNYKSYLNFAKVDLKNADLELSDECYKIVELLKNISHHNQAAKFRISEDWITWSNLVDDLISISNDKYELCRQLMSFVSFTWAKIVLRRRGAKN